MPERVWRFTRAEREWICTQASAIGARVDGNASWTRAYMFLGEGTSVSAELAVSIDLIGPGDACPPDYRVGWSSYPVDGIDGCVTCSLNDAVMKAVQMLSRADAARHEEKPDA